MSPHDPSFCTIPIEFSLVSRSKSICRSVISFNKDISNSFNEASSCTGWNRIDFEDTENARNLTNSKLANVIVSVLSNFSILEVLIWNWSCLDFFAGKMPSSFSSLITGFLNNRLRISRWYCSGSSVRLLTVTSNTSFMPATTSISISDGETSTISIWLRILSS
ncbi:hypothetical protein OGATHE_003223 [Ogataea polymorpha]|uniref:Uncharacterized protein n=1 Tax=Ogataea polymorpha TaxID=460523 RepID=A0A9P8T724_9ASCO|nr:hypothetical protein OGATHE_003223 [Ogataea polymorpha]